MDREKLIENFEIFLRENKEEIRNKVQRIEDLPPDDEWFDDEEWEECCLREEGVNMGKSYNIGDIWYVHFPFEDTDDFKRRPAIVIGKDLLAVLTIYVTSQNKTNPYSIEIKDWKEAGLQKPSWAIIDRIVGINEWYIDSFVGRLSDSDLNTILPLSQEILSGEQHEFTLLAVIKDGNEFLQVYDERWECWLFPYTRSTDNNKANADSFASSLLDENVTTSYVNRTIHCKYSESDKIYKIYNHKLYAINFNQVFENSIQNHIESNTKKFKWMTFEEMEKNPEIMQKNEDVVAFVKANCAH